MISLPLDRERLADWRGWMPVGAEILLWLLLAVQAARLAWLLAAPVSASGSDVPVPATAGAQMRLPAIDLFYRTAAAGRSGHATEALGYRLHGLRVGPDGASAILGKDGKQVSYAEGDALEGGARLDAVHADHVWLVAGGARHRLDLLRLDGPRGGTRAAAALPVGAAATPARPATGATAKPASPTNTAASATGADAAKPPADGEGIRAAQLLDAGMTDAAGGLAARVPGGRAALLKLAGLREDDVVLSVDGRPLDAASLGTLGKDLAGRSQLSIRYRRDGRIHTTTLNMPR